MNSKEYWGLSEAYAEVYAPQEIDEADSLDAMQARREKRLKAQRKREGTTSTGRDFGRDDRLTSDQQKSRRDAEYKAGTRKEEFDIFHNILEHLIDEGYADTEEAAIAIMANMSEEWRESILESGYFPTPESQRADEAKYKLRGQNVKPRTTQTQIGAKMKPTVNK